MRDCELMLMALYALQRGPFTHTKQIQEALRERLSQPEREWVGLDDDEVNEMSLYMVKANKSVEWLSRRIEAKLKERNT